MNLAVTYLLGALVATVANVASQELLWRLLDHSGLYWSMTAGTGIGLLVKYVWDKRLIFAYRPASRTHDLVTFLRYAFMGLATTAIFWAVELAFLVRIRNRPAAICGRCDRSRHRILGEIPPRQAVRLLAVRRLRHEPPLDEFAHDEVRHHAVALG